MSKENKKRLNIMIDVDVLASIDDYAEKNGVSRGSAISILCIETLQQKNFMTNFPALLQAAMANEAEKNK